MIRIEAVWLSTAPLDMRAGMDTALARVVAVFGEARPHHAYCFANRRANRIFLAAAFLAATFLVAAVFLVGIVGYSLNGTNGVVTAGIIDACKYRVFLRIQVNGQSGPWALHCQVMRRCGEGGRTGKPLDLVSTACAVH